MKEVTYEDWQKNPTPREMWDKYKNKVWNQEVSIQIIQVGKIKVRG